METPSRSPFNGTLFQLLWPPCFLPHQTLYPKSCLKKPSLHIFRVQGLHRELKDSNTSKSGRSGLCGKTPTLNSAAEAQGIASSSAKWVCVGLEGHGSGSSIELSTVWGFSGSSRVTHPPTGFSCGTLGDTEGLGFSEERI